MSSEFEALPGAVGSPPEHYGNPLGEQRWLANGEAIVDLSDRGILTVTGPDRLSWLDSITSQSLKRLVPGDSAETLLLDISGRIEYAARIVDDGEATWLLLEAEEAEGLAAYLDRMRFMLRVEVANVSDRFATIGSLGTPDLPAVAPHGTPVVWEDPWPTVVAGGHQYSPVAEHPGLRWTWREYVVERSALASIADRVAAGEFHAAGTLAMEALRVEAWRPRRATEVDERSIPHELDWLRSAVHLSKGCYKGQETIAKVHNLGHPPRRLVMLHLDGSDGVLPVPGDEVLLEDAVVGRITSAALHHELGPIALAVVKRGADPTAVLTVTTGDTVVSAAQEVIVPQDAGAEANVPRLPRLGAVPRRS